MHEEAREGFAWALSAAGLDPDAPYSVLDMGGQNVNGSVHDLLPHAAFTTLDLENADIIADARTWTSDTERWDLVIATEVFEHVREWRAIIIGMGLALDPTGPGVIIATCASTGRRPHGATGALDPAPGEWYRNVGVTELEVELARRFTEYEVRYSNVWGDAYMWARTPRHWS